MEEVLSRRLQLAYYNADGSQSTLSPKYFDEGFIGDKEKLREWMADFSKLELFYNQEKDIQLYTETKGAQLIETKRIDLLA
ncbi:hypothetical protein I6N95_03615 [Vagococcus sp. BWB3-3]|uniref:Uncharacterized protein n=1 Tax=Vagococcus allomyrinae TaxID=2794353 RepID=A0A940STA3_9ENTE|nr:hypothetical protein [Vagococcus allomyrinae]MBP1040095.1 hypothetical protein [Vagococcus allomyrinae]